MSQESELEQIVRRRIGTTLRGKYRLDAVLGMGGMAAVYHATHRNQAEFAIKMLHPSLSLHEDIRQRFLREGYAANSVRHAGVVRVVDDDVAEDGSAFLVMELVRGADLDALWERGGRRLPAAAALAVADQLLDVLVAAHGKGIVHRDIKPANLFVTTDGSLRVLDFGIARARDAASTTAAATGTGLVLGTPAYMSPEQALAKSSEVDAQTDLWAVGATMFSLLTGRTVHEADNAQQILIKTATTPARSLRSLAPELPSCLVQLVDRALAFDKADRWSSATSMHDAVVRAAQEILGGAPGPDALASLLTSGGTAVPRAALASAPTEEATPEPAPRGESSGDAGSPAGARPFPSTSTEEPYSVEPVVPRSSARMAVLYVASAAALTGLAVLGAVAWPRSPVEAPPAVSISAAAVATLPPVAAPVVPASPSQQGPASPVTPPPPASGSAGPAVQPAAAAPRQSRFAGTPTPAPAPRAPCRTTTWVDGNGETHAKQVCE